MRAALKMPEGEPAADSSTNAKYPIYPVLDFLSANVSVLGIQ